MFVESEIIAPSAALLQREPAHCRPRTNKVKAAQNCLFALFNYFQFAAELSDLCKWSCAPVREVHHSPVATAAPVRARASRQRRCVSPIIGIMSERTHRADARSAEHAMSLLGASCAGAPAQLARGHASARRHQDAGDGSHQRRARAVSAALALSPSPARSAPLHAARRARHIINGNLSSFYKQR